jgi:hypothetical protein
MKKFLEENKGLLNFYCIAARIIGWALVCGGIVWFLLYVLCILVVSDAAGELRWPYQLKNVIYSTSSFVFEFLFPGLVVLIVAQLIRYIIANKSKHGRLLQYGGYVLYTYAALVIGKVVLQYYLYLGDSVIFEEQGGRGLLFIQPLVIPVAAKVLIIIGLAQALRRVMPVIEEWKTLV